MVTESEVQKELAALLQDFIANAQSLVSRLQGAAPAAAEAVAGGAAPAFRIPGTPAAAAEAIQSLANLFAIGVKERPYDGHSFFIATEPLVTGGNDTDIGRAVDFVMILPSIDAQLDFDDSPIKNTTPTISGGTVLRHPVRSRVIHHRAVSATLTGTISVFAYWWVA